MKRSAKINDTQRRLLGPFTALARTMSEKWDIVIRASGAALYTDGKTIVFPWNADDIDTIPFAVLHGYLDHEVGHIRAEREHKAATRETPLTIMKRLDNATLKMLLNVYEDIRMEIQFGSEYIGVAENLAAAMDHCTDMFEKRHGTGEHGNFWHTLGCAIISAARGYSLSWLPKALQPYMELLEPEIAASRRSKWGRDSEQLAIRTRDKILAHAKEVIKELEEKKKKRADERTEGEEGDDEGASVHAEDAEEEQDGGAEYDAEDAGAAAKLAGEDATREHLMDAVGEDIAKASEKAHDESGDYMPDPESLKRDRWVDPGSGTREQYNGLKSIVSGQTSALRTKLARVLRVLTEARVQHDQEQGRLDTQALAQLRVNNKRVFSTTTPAIELGTAVQLLVDMSGSMGPGDYVGTKAYFAKMTCIALSEALSALGIPFEVIGFDNDDGDCPSPSGDYVTRAPLRMRVFKSFAEQHRVVAPRLCHITGISGNSDGEAIMLAAHRLAARPERAKLLFVLSDGEPCCHISSGDYVTLGKHLKQMVTKIQKAGIQVIGVGVNHANIVNYYPNAIQVSDLSTMAADIFKVVSKRIIAGVKSRRAA